jgi:hypothetical protein
MGVLPIPHMTQQQRHPLGDFGFFVKADSPHSATRSMGR